MDSKGRNRMRVDLDAVANLDMPPDFARSHLPVRRVDARVLELARILGRQAAREDLARAANDNEPADGSKEGNGDAS